MFKGGLDDLNRLKHGESSSGESIKPREILGDKFFIVLLSDRGRLEVVATFVVEIGGSCNYRV